LSFEFNEFVVDTRGCRLLRDGEELRIERRAFDLLHYLIAHRDRVVSKEELLAQVWGTRALTDGALSNTVAKLRRALRQAVHDKHPIETIHGRGYRFHLPAQGREPEQARAQRGSSRDRFVGRAQLMRSLLERLDPLDGSSENLIVLAGEAGIGKTRTARELAACAAERGHSVWLGAAYEAAGAPPYWPWIQILRRAHAELPSELFQPELSSALTQLIPELGQVASAPLLEPLVARFQLFDEVSQLLRRAAGHKPRLLLLDDLQSADSASVELLERLVRALSGLPLMFVATLRTGEPSQGEHAPLSRLARVATVRRLSGLSAAEVAELATVQLDHPRLERRHVRVLHERTQGNPLFIRQALDLIDQRDDWSFVAEGTPVAELPGTIAHVIRRRLVGLSAESLQTLEAAAVIGNTFEVPLLSEVTQRAPEPLIEQLEEALRSGLIERAPDAPDSFAFAHVLLRESLYQELASSVAGQLHARIASALERRAGPDRSRHPSRAHPHAHFDLGAIAHHALLAAPFELTRAIDACRSAAKAAQDASSFEVAAQLRLRAIAKLTAHGGSVESHCRLLIELGEDQFYAGLITRAWSAFRDAAEVARAAARVDLLAELAPRLVDCLELGVGDPYFARAAVDEALAAGAGERASLLAQRAELALELPAEARFQLLDEAAELAERAADHAAILEVAHSRAILRDPSCLALNEAAAGQFLALAERYPEAAAGMRYRSLRPFGAYLTRYLCALTACDLAAADLALVHCAHIAESSHVRAARLGVALMRAGRALADGRLDDLQSMIPLPLGQATPELPSEGDAWAGYLGALLAARARLDPRGMTQTLASMSTQLGAATHRSYVLIGQARLLAKVGAHDQARALLAQLPADQLARMPVQYGDLGNLCALAEVAHLQADTRAAEALYPKLQRYAAYNAVGPSFEYSGAVAHFAGLLARLLGHDARALFQQAVDINGRLGMAGQRALSERALASA
jgi:DNA-binding winged helix-turn-helix (wHTH) protein